MVKNRSITSPWAVYHQNLADDENLRLNEISAKSTENRFNSTDPTATVFSLSNDSSVAGDNAGESLIAYCWHGVAGYSKFGGYDGNGNSDGPFVYLGFKPAWLLVKNVDQASRNWQVLDNMRDPVNPCNNFLRVGNSTAAEGNSHDVNFLSNGFKIKNADADYNESGQTFIYAAFAEMPFKYATAR